MDLRIDEGSLREFFSAARSRQLALDNNAVSLRVTSNSLPEGSAALEVAPGSFRRLAPDPSPCRMAAVDGGSVVLHDAGTALLVARRAGFVVYEGQKLMARAVGPVNVSLLTESNAWDEVGDACAEVSMGEFAAPPASLDLRDAHDALRGLEEWRAARDALQFLQPGDVLLLDGALEARGGKPPGLLLALLEGARRRGVAVVGVSKTSGLGVEGRVPLTFAADRLAAGWGLAAPWWLPVFPRASLAPECRGDVLVARFAAEGPDAYRVDVASRDPFAAAEDALARVAPHCRDVAYLGYPYPLARMHNDVAFSPDLVLEARASLRERAARLGFTGREFDALFGDRHRILDINR